MTLCYVNLLITVICNPNCYQCLLQLIKMFSLAKFCRSCPLENIINLSQLQCSFKHFGTHKDVSKVGFIGLGAMGSRMANNLLKKYKEVYVYDVNESATVSLAADGATAVKRVEDLRHVECVVTMLPANQQVYDVYHGPDGLINHVSDGTLLIDCSTVDPEVPKTLSAVALERNITFVDAPVSGGILAAASGQLTFMVGGSEEGLQRSEPVLRSMGKNVIHCGASGAGQVAKICNNMVLGISMIAIAEAMNLGIRLGMDAKTLASVINSSSGRCWSSDSYNPVPGVQAAVPASNNYQGGFMSRLLLKDLGLAESVAERSKAPIQFGKQALNVYKDICKSGKADLDFSVVYQYLQESQQK